MISFQLHKNLQIKLQQVFTTLILVLFLFSGCKNKSDLDFLGSVYNDNQFVLIEGMITFKFKTEDTLNLVISRQNHQNKYCSLHLYLEYKKKV